MTDTSGGYRSNPFTAEFYDYVVPYRERQDVTFYVEQAQAAGGPVLEAGCGTGRILIPTARAGLTITGLDLAESMLAVARTRLADEPDDVQARVTLVHGNMCDFDLGRQFALVTSPFRSFQHLITVEDQLCALASFRQHLVDGGWLVLDLFNPSLPYLVDESRLGEFGEEPEFTMPDGRRVVRRSKIISRDLTTQVQNVALIYDITHPDGQKERHMHEFAMRYLFRYEAEHLLERAGFRVEVVYGDYDQSAFGSKYPGELILVARKG